ncbi:MAG TPA: F0F1 ATP synthase subunit epsilon [Clostridia bacterium]|nr:F0F1 ATP synthase subunit epsilon [Clostridia bacterium]
MSKKITLEVVTPERVVLREEVESFVAPAKEGYLGVLPGHAPLVAELSIGVLTYKTNGQKRAAAVSGGFMEVAQDKAVLLADTAELAEEIDVDRALRAKQRAEERLAKRDPGLDVARAEAALRRAMARLKAANAESKIRHSGSGVSNQHLDH